MNQYHLIVKCENLLEILTVLILSITNKMCPYLQAWLTPSFLTSATQ